MDHAVTAIGYGNDGTQNYYIVRNSWGPLWGDKGYVKIAAVPTGPGICGIQQFPVYPKVDSAVYKDSPIVIEYAVGGAVIFLILLLICCKCR